jgi:hypothetical protein
MLPRFDHRADRFQYRNERLACLRLEPAWIERAVVCRAMWHERIPRPGLPLQAERFAGARATEDTDAPVLQQGTSAAGRRPRRILHQKLLLPCELHNGLHVVESLVDHRPRVRLGELVEVDLNLKRCSGRVT